MTTGIVLASGSEIRQKLLQGANVNFKVAVARVDEAAIMASLLADTVPPRDIADALADAKARKISQRHPGALVIGCDQVLEIEGRLLTKPETEQDAMAQLQLLSGQTHRLFSAVVIYQNGTPNWRFVGTVKIHMRATSDNYLTGYLDRNWQSIRHSVGCYKLEEEGSRLISKVEGDYFTVLGLPLLEILTYLTDIGELPV